MRLFGHAGTRTKQDTFKLRPRVRVVTFSSQLKTENQRASATDARDGQLAHRGLRQQNGARAQGGLARLETWAENNMISVWQSTKILSQRTRMRMAKMRWEEGL